MKNRLISKFAYTLIEILIVMSVMSVLLVISFPAINSYSRERSLSQSLDILKQAVDRAKSNASATPTGFDITKGDSFQVVFEIGSTPPQKIYICQSPYNYDIANQIDCNQTEFTLPKGIQIQNIYAGNSTVPINVDYAGIRFKTNSKDMTMIYKDTADLGYGPLAFSANELKIKLSLLANSNQSKNLIIHAITGAIYAE